MSLSNPPSDLPTLPQPQERGTLRSCKECRRRKVGCNKTQPCSNCCRTGVECIYPAPGRTRRRTTTGLKRRQQQQHLSSADNPGLLDRLSRLESIIGHFCNHNDNDGINVQVAEPNSKSMALPPARAMESANFTHLRDSGSLSGRLVVDQGRSRYVSSRLWASLGDEVRAIFSFFYARSSHSC